jgi:UPF0176 protein
MRNQEFTIITFYEFKKSPDIYKIKGLLRRFCIFNKIKGTILISNEGINGTVAGLSDPILLLKKELIKIGFENLELKYSYYVYMPFNRLKIKIKNEIISFAGIKLDPKKSRGKHIDSSKWNNLISDKNTLLIDVRNSFECDIGSFEGAVNPKTKNFSEFKNYVNNKLLDYKERKIAMFCTGGIRCEKASSYMSSMGFKNVSQLKGGILKYLEKIPKKESMWRGECFVFDNRVSVKNELLPGSYDICHSCRLPISLRDRSSNDYEKGISCPKCINKSSKQKKIRLMERNKQIKIAKKRGLYNPYIKHTTANF